MKEYLQAAELAKPLVGRYGGPLGLLGKVVGLTVEDTEQGIPWWGWLGVGMLAGGVFAYAARNKIEKIASA